MLIIYFMRMNYTFKYIYRCLFIKVSEFDSSSKKTKVTWPNGVCLFTSCLLVMLSALLFFIFLLVSDVFALKNFTKWEKMSPRLFFGWHVIFKMMHASIFKTKIKGEGHLVVTDSPRSLTFSKVDPFTSHFGIILKSTFQQLKHSLQWSMHNPENTLLFLVVKLDPFVTWFIPFVDKMCSAQKPCGFELQSTDNIPTLKGVVTYYLKGPPPISLGKYSWTLMLCSLLYLPNVMGNVLL